MKQFFTMIKKLICGKSALSHAVVCWKGQQFTLDSMIGGSET